MNWTFGSREDIASVARSEVAASETSTSRRTSPPATRWRSSWSTPRPSTPSSTSSASSTRSVRASRKFIQRSHSSQSVLFLLAGYGEMILVYICPVIQRTNTHLWVPASKEIASYTRSVAFYPRFMFFPEEFFPIPTKKDTSMCS